jgi:hypothetical protein
VLLHKNLISLGVKALYGKEFYLLGEGFIFGLQFFNLTTLSGN